MAATPRQLVVVGLSDDERTDLRACLSRSGWRLVSFDALAKADAHVRTGTAAGAVIDLRKFRAAATIAGWRSLGLGLPVLVLSSPRGGHAECLAAGATHCLVEPFTVEPLAERVRAMGDEAGPLGETLAVGKRIVDLQSREVRTASGTTPLTRNELALLTYLAERPGRTVDHRTLLSEVFGYSPNSRTRTLVTTMARLRAKIEDDPRHPVALRSVYGVGYRFVHAVSAAAPGRAAEVFVGRDTELAEVHERIEAHALVTVVGPGGSGKTRLAVELANRTEGSVFCPLQNARSRMDIVRAVATATGVRLDGAGDPWDGLCAGLRSRGGLLILDNFEHLQEQTDLVRSLVDPPTGLTVLVTSRIPLRLASEHRYRLAPLALPDPEARPSEILACPSVALFAARSEALGRPVEDAQARDVAHIVRAVDGLPLAIELVAAWSETMPPATLRQYLGRALDVTSRGPSDADARHKTLRAALQWSWGLLDDDARRTLAQCSVFRGGFTLDAASEVVVLPDERWVLDALSTLVEHGLVNSDLGEDEARYSLLETVRSFAAEQLGAQAEDVARRHARHYAQLGEPAFTDALHGWGGVALATRLLADADNVLRAAAWAAPNASPETAVALARAALEILELRGPPGMAEVLIRPVLARPISEDERASLLRRWAVQSARADDDTSSTRIAAEALSLAQGVTRGWALVTMAQMVHRQGHWAEAEALTEEGIEVLAEHEDARGEAWALRFRGNLHLRQAELTQARDVYLRALNAHRLQGDRRAEAATLGNLGIVEARAGNLDQARELYKQAAALHRTNGNTSQEAAVRGNAAILDMYQGRLRAAEAGLTAALRHHRRASERRAEARVLGNLALLRGWQGQLEACESMSRQAMVMHHELGNVQMVANVHTNLAQILSQSERDLEDAGRFRRVEFEIETALDAARRANHRATEAINLGNLADLYLRVGQPSRARDPAESAAAVVADRTGRQAGVLEGIAAEVELALGSVESGLERVARAEQMLAASHAWMELAEVACRRGRMELSAGDPEAAKASLDRAEQAVAHVGLGERAPLAITLAALRAAIAGDATTSSS